MTPCQDQAYCKFAVIVVWTVQLIKWGKW